MTDQTIATSVAPADETRAPLENVGMQWLVFGLAPGVDWLVGTNTRNEAIGYIENERPTPDRHDFFAVIKARDLFGEPGMAKNPAGDEDDALKPHEIAAKIVDLEQQLDGLVDPDEQDRLLRQARGTDMTPANWSLSADTGNPIFAWMLEEFRPSEVDALIGAILQAGDETDVPRIAFLNAVRASL